MYETTFRNIRALAGLTLYQEKTYGSRHEIIGNRLSKKLDRSAWLDSS
ncbi:MAG: hypothetical protein OJF49_003661 [Ktedonobacterales bacterium]|nr:MAG: hypothetical protein OJF49_003661 [Ktedonobacterales bacterium]